MGYITNFSDLKKEVTTQQSEPKAEVLLQWIFTALTRKCGLLAAQAIDIEGYQ